MEQPLSLVVLAAGEGKRFRSSVPKPLHPAAGRPLLWHVLAAAAPLGADPVVVVIGRGADQVREAVDGFGLGPVRTALQPEQLGTGDALAKALPELPDHGAVLVLYGDTPLLETETLQELVATHRAKRAEMTLLTFTADDPTGYGRVVRDNQGTVAAIVEHRDAQPEQLAIREVNAGVYVFERSALELLGKVQPANAQGEYYLPDLLPLIVAGGGVVATAQVDEAATRGVNDRAQLAAAGAALRARILDRLMASGVTVVDPATTFVDVDVEVGPDTTLLPLTFLEAGTRIGDGCVIGPNTRLTSCTVGDGASVTQAVGVKASVGPGAVVGPFAYLRPGADLGPNSKVGTYVEVKGSRIGAGSKVPHLSYVGDAEIGEKVNVGAGVIFVNYDGSTKHPTTVGDRAFIGSDTMLVAPVTIGPDAQTAAGSTISKDVPAGALGIERADQRNIAGWAERRRQRRADAAQGPGPGTPAGTDGESPDPRRGTD